MINDTLDLILDLSRFDAHTRSEINSEMLKLEKELKKKLQEPLTEWGRARVEKLLAECEQVIGGYYDDATKTLGGATDGVIGIAVKSTVAAMVASVPASVDVGLPTANMLKSIMGDAMVLGNPVSDWMGKQSQDTVFKFKSEVRQGLLQGETNQEIIKRVAPVLDVSRRNVAAVVQTAVHSVASEARQATYDKNYDICGGWVYVSTMDSHSCLICQSYSGARWDADKKPLSGKSWVTVPRHVNCLVGDTLISAIDDVTGVSKRWFDGKVFIVKTTSGRIITGTPNHPILTDRGWIGLGFINESDSIISDSISKWGSGIDGDNKDAKPSIHYFVKSFLRSRKVLTMPVPVSAPNFHGDGLGSKIAIVNSNSFLSSECNASFIHHFVKNVFVFRNNNIKCFFSSFCGLFFCFRRSDATKVCSPSVSENTLSLFSRCYSHPRKLLLASISKFNSIFLKNGINPFSSYSQFPSYAFRAYAGIIKLYHLAIAYLCSGNSGGILSNYFNSMGGESSIGDRPSNGEFDYEIPDFSASEVFFDKVVSVEDSFFHGYVYNLETEKGWYIANGIITHNCRCAIVMETKTFSELGLELPEPKFGTRASDQGQVSMDLTFDDFLKGKSDAYVDEMLGKGRAKLFKDGKITLSDLTNGNGKPLTLQQLQDKYK